MDDMLVFEPSVKKLKEDFEQMNALLEQNLKLNFKPPVYSRCKDGIPFLGKLIFANKIFLLREKYNLKKKKIKKIDYLVKKGKLTEQKAAERITAIMAYKTLCKKKTVKRSLRASAAKLPAPPYYIELFSCVKTQSATILVYPF